MTKSLNFSSVKFEFRDVHGEVIEDDVEVKFYNRQLPSDRKRARLRSRKGAEPLEVSGITAIPFGTHEVFIQPRKYRSKSIFVTVPSERPAEVSEVFFVNPETAVPVLPNFAEIESAARWLDLRRILLQSAHGEREWNHLSPECKAGLLNIYAKLQREVVDARPLTAYVESVIDFQPERMIARVTESLIAKIRKSMGAFHVVPGSLHTFPNGWLLVENEGSFKTFDPAGNIQITFAQNSSGQFLADIDIDDHQGVQHAADVLKHKLTGRDTHPYDIHQILVFFQNVDPGYSFV